MKWFFVVIVVSIALVVLYGMHEMFKALGWTDD